LLDKRSFGVITINRGEIKVVKDEAPPPLPPTPATPLSTSDRAPKTAMKDTPSGTPAPKGPTVDSAPTELSVFLGEFGLGEHYATISKANVRGRGEDGS
jgi:hypothetical protein